MTKSDVKRVLARVRSKTALNARDKAILRRLLSRARAAKKRKAKAK